MSDRGRPFLVDQEARRRHLDAQVPKHIPLPAPEHTSRDPWPTGLQAPKGARDLASLATSAEWVVTLTYARGPRLDKRGQLSGIFHSILVRGARPGCQFIAAYVCSVDGEARRWVGDGVLITRGDCGIFPHASITDLKGWVLDRGDVPSEWYESIATRIAAQRAKAKAAAKARPKKAREDVS